MSNELINALENRVNNAVDTIEGLRSDNRVLKEERQRLEEQLSQLLRKIEGAETSNPEPATSYSHSEPTASFSNPEPEENISAPIERPGMGLGSSVSDF